MSDNKLEGGAGDDICLYEWLELSRDHRGGQGKEQKGRCGKVVSEVLRSK